MSAARRASARAMRAASALGVGLALLASAGCENKNNVSAQQGFNSDHNYTRVAPDQRQKAPVLTGETLDGKQLSTQGFAGKVVVVNIWGSWCSPCRKEAPELARAARATASVAQFVGVDTRDADVAQGQAFQRAFHVGYPSLFDPDGKQLLGFGHLPPSAIPTTVVIDRQGRIAARIMGGTDASTIEGTVNDIAAGK